MKVSDILQIKGNTLFTVTPDTSLMQAVHTMSEHDIGSLVVMEYGDLVGMLVPRDHPDPGGEQWRRGHRQHPQGDGRRPADLHHGDRRRRGAPHDAGAPCALPVMDNRTLMGVISFYDVAKAVVEEQSFENRMLKAYIRDWPEERAD